MVLVRRDDECEVLLAEIKGTVIAVVFNPARRMIKTFLGPDQLRRKRPC